MKNEPNVNPVVDVVVVAVLAAGMPKANPVAAVVVPPCVAAPKLNPPARSAFNTKFRHEIKRL